MSSCRLSIDDNEYVGVVRKEWGWADISICRFFGHRESLLSMSAVRLHTRFHHPLVGDYPILNLDL